MLNIPDEVKALFKRDGVHHNFHVHFPNGEYTDLNNENILQESVQFTESLCSQEYFKFGLAESSQIEFTAVGIPNVLGAEIECGIEVDCSSLGSQWAAQNPPSYYADFLEPQPFVDGQRAIQSVESGSGFSFTYSSGEIVDMIKFELNVTYSRTGSGDPSPTNVRRISGKNGIKIYVSPTASISDGTTYEIIPSGSTYYNGKLNVLTGAFQTSMVLVLLGSIDPDSWERTTIAQVAGGGTSYYGWRTAGLPQDLKFPESDNVAPNVVCSAYKVVSKSTQSYGSPYTSPPVSISFRTVSGVRYMYVYDSRYTTAASKSDFVSAIQNYQLLYELENAIEMQLTPPTFSFYTGTNNVSSNLTRVTFYGGIRPHNGTARYRIPYGKFIVDSCPRNHGAMYFRHITAYTKNKFEDIDFMPGQFPNSSLKVDPVLWLTAQETEKSDMEHITMTATPSPGEYIFYVYDMEKNTSATDVYGISSIGGVSRAYNGIYNSWTIEIARQSSTVPFGVYEIIVDYNEHEFDSYGKQFFDTAMESIPSGSFIYTSTLDETDKYRYTKIFNDNYESVSLNFGWFSPCIFIEVDYNIEVSGSYTLRTFKRFSKPIFIKPGIPYFLDLDRLDEMQFYMKPPKGSWESSAVRRIYVSVPMRWRNTAQWNQWGDDPSVGISGWSDAAPFGERETVERSGNVEVYYKKIETEQSLPRIEVQNTLNFSKGKGLGNYYTYSNAISPSNILEGTMELLGRFWKVNRTGESGEFNISENQTVTPIGKESWEEFWWDENDVDPIGEVRVKYATGGNNSGEQMLSVSVGNGESLYTIENNGVLESSNATAEEIQNFVETYFAPNAEAINFTPVDLRMKGLPYLEVGDYIGLIAEDGEEVETLILEQTITGVQHLIADITSVNGELLEVIEG